MSNKIVENKGLEASIENKLTLPKQTSQINKPIKISVKYIELSINLDDVKL
jgi:hypothetical protein